MLVGASLVLAVVWARAWVSARIELDAATAAEADGDLAEAIERCQFAMRWYSPLAGAPQEAADRLDAIAARAEAAGDRATALAALRRLRGAIRAVRGITDPFGDRAAAVDERLAVLTAEQQLAEGLPTLRGRSREALIADHRRLLAMDPTPTLGWSLAVVLGFAGWLGGATLTITRGMDADARLIRPRFWRYLALTLASFALWISGLVYA